MSSAYLIRQDFGLATMKLQQAKTLPEVLTIEQVHRIIDACRVERMVIGDSPIDLPESVLEFAKR